MKSKNQEIEFYECIELNEEDFILLEPPPLPSELEQALQYLRRARKHLRQAVDQVLFSVEDY